LSILTTLSIVKYINLDDCKFLIFAHHIEVLDGIEKEVIDRAVNYIRIDGSVGNERRHNCVNKFQNEESCKIAILAITACATGLTLTKASTVVFAEMYFTPAVMMQAEDRAHRIGQEHNCVNVHYLYGSETIDEMIFPKLKEKFGVVTSTLDNKRMDMNVEKIKSGCVGDISAISSTQKLLNVVSNTPQSGKKKKTIMDYFTKPKVIKEEAGKENKKNETIELNPDDVDNLLTMIQEEALESTAFADKLDHKDINLHETECKRKHSVEDINEINHSNSSGKRKI
jgi:hypothetical protein